MERPRKAFLQRKALADSGNGNRGWHQLSILLLACGWNFVLLNFDIVHAGESGVVSDNMCWHEKKSGLEAFAFGVEFQTEDMCFVPHSCHSCGADAAKEGERAKALSRQEDNSKINEKLAMETNGLQEGSQKDHLKSDKLSRDRVLGYDEFKHKVINSKNRPAVGQNGSVMHRVEPDGTEYNYASASKGAKVLAFNKEAKGASNILGKDEDKYLRNPCSAEEKFVVIELSEETLVDTIELANFEHYSSNLKDFELWGSAVYPTDKWVKLGNFTAKNVKQSQRFTLNEAKWARYLKLKLLSHYGSEFYCTLSLVQVYGVDAVEQMLEDLIAVQGDVLTSAETIEGHDSAPPQPLPSKNDGFDQQSLKEEDSEVEYSDPKHAVPKSEMQDLTGDRRSQHVGRMPGDAVLKILMQKVQKLDANLSVLERYLEELHSRYKDIFRDIDKEMEEKDELFNKLRSDITSFSERQDLRNKDVSELIAWKSFASLRMDDLKRENTVLRLEVQRISENQVHMDNKGIVVLLISLICSILAVTKLTVCFVVRVCIRKQNFEKLYVTDNSWIMLLLSSSAVVFILLL